MEIGQIHCDNLGMTRDTAVSQLGQKQDGSTNYAFENHNIRILAVNDNTKFTVTNEKSTKKHLTLKGTFIGSCKLNNYLVVFIKTNSSTNSDHIYRLNYTGTTINSVELYHGDLNFDTSKPIEALGYYESEEIQKVYWVDGLNSNRFINIVADDDTRATWRNDSFDFQGTINIIPSVVVSKSYENVGYFTAGVLQYFISYYNKYGVETCIAWNSDLQYIALSDRGAKADENVGCSFNLQISDIDHSYDYLRIYSVYRSGIDGTPSARIVADIAIEEGVNTISYTDNGVIGEAFDANNIPFVGGQNIIANTLDYKQDTLFLGDVKVSPTNVTFQPAKKDVFISDLNTSIKENACDAIQWVYKFVSDIASSGVYNHTQETNESQKEIAGFKWREVYRFGIQFMDEKGEWTSAFWLGDKYCNLKPREILRSNLRANEQDVLISSAQGHNYLEEDNSLVTYSKDGAYIAQAWVDVNKLEIPNEYKGKAYRLLMAETNTTNRRIVEQGVLNPTMFNFSDRCFNRPYSIPSWIFRPRKSSIVNRHFDTIPVQTESNAEIQGITKRQVPAIETQSASNYNAFMLIFAPNQGPRIKWKLIYYNTGSTDDEKVVNLQKVYDGTNTGVYDTNYRVISSGTVNCKNWSEATSKFFSTLITDITNSGERVVLSAAMLPDPQLMKDAMRNSEANKNVWAVVGASLAAVALAVASVFTCGAAASLAPAAAMAVSAVASMLASASIASASVASTMATKIQDFDEIDQRLLRKSIYCINEKHTVSARIHAAQNISDLLSIYFKGRQLTSSDSHRQYIHLIGDAEEPFFVGGQSDLGENYNAYALSGELTQLTPEEDEKQRKQSLFCIDESIVTLNSPTVEDTVYSVDKSEGLKLDIVGMIPIEAVHGEYQLQTTNGLNNSAQVIPHRDVNNGISSLDIQGILNGDFYQDTYISPASLAVGITEGHLKPVQVTADTKLYRQFMWGRESSASLWMPGIQLIKATAVSIDGTYTSDDYVNEAPAQILNKTFANLRYSTNTIYKEPYEISIESPVACLDDDTFLKQFNYNNDTMYYYKNVDTLVPFYNENYPLIVNGSEYPGIVTTEEGTEIDLTELAQCNDPTHIKFKQTPHILIPFRRTESGVSNILPYLEDEVPITPSDMYEGLENLRLDGVNNQTIPVSSYQYKVLEAPTWNKGSEEESVLSDRDRIDLMCAASSSLYGLVTVQRIQANDTDLVNEPNFRRNTNIDSVMLATFTVGTNYLVHSNTGYYRVYYLNGSWRIKKITTIQTNAKVTTQNIARMFVFVPNQNSTSGTYVGGTFKTTNSDNLITAVVWNENFKYVLGTEIETTIPTNLSDILVDYPIENTWNQSQLSWYSSSPYLFLGELVKKNFDYDSWNGGTSANALEQLNWIVASEVTPLTKSILDSWGDTYYQRWDCEKTYPYTEEDKNSVVDVLSFMLESHTNLDGRCDVNRGIGNLLNLRPTNTILNRAYSQTDNFFSYKTLDEKFSKEHFEADVVWSLSKNNMDDIDKWTSLTALNEMSLDGRYGAIRKILNVNDTLVSFQDSAISAIEFNQKTAISTEAGVPLQLGNTGKVTGYQIVSDTTGCRNKWSINKNSASVFYIDDLNKSFNAFSTNGGAQNIGIQAEFSQWFKQRITGNLWSPDNKQAFRTSYDELTHDLYIMNSDTCLIYNTLLGRFTSFMDYVDTPTVVNLADEEGKVKSFTLHSAFDSARQEVVEAYELFAGPGYGEIYGKFAPYSIEYRVSPDPRHDSIFTNYVYEADWINPLYDVDESGVFDSLTRRLTSFDTIDAWNEYQRGTLPIGNTPLLLPYNQKAKFRVWRGNIPRDGDGVNTLAMNRMRNPWIHLKFTKNTPDDSKMIFHNLTVTYYNQYGRY